MTKRLTNINSSTQRLSKRALMLYVPSEVYALIKQEGEAARPPAKPGPMAAEILRQYFEKETINGKRSANTSA